ncbi:MAG TPA: protease pro-enzyme activation domain-containing protein [Pseudomonadales bacterium]|nr:protease pro-enzyme activation domain-containing protein [Pseudomonadales bacterium]
MKTNRNIFNVGLVAVLALALFPRGATAQTTKTLHGHVPSAISRFGLRTTGDLATNSTLDLAISLPLHNQKGLADLISQVYDPSSPNYRHFLTPGQFYGQFGPNEQDYQMAVNFAKVNGLSIIGTSSNHMVLDVRGRVSDIEKAFQVKLRTYHHPKENREFYAPDKDPSINASLPIMHISGLDNFVIPQPLFHQMSAKPTNVKPAFGSGPGGEYMGKDFRAAYVPGVSLDGTGQSIALFELDGYFTADILAYEAQAGLPSVTLTNIAVNGGVPSPTAFGDPEVSLDIEMIISMATNASIIVYEAPNGGLNSPVDLLNRIAADDTAKQISSSWGIGDNPAYDLFYQEMAVQGQSFFQASGDDGAYYSGNEQIEEYADDTNITLVGGTTLYTTGPQGAWSSEAVWSWFVQGFGNSASGGGTNFNGLPIPGWQQGISMANNQGSTTLRNIPDVALTADNLYVIFENGQTGFFGGTSAAAPLWAAFTALVNQQALASSKSTVGFLNPALYAIGKSAIYTNCFHDVTTGNNTNFILGNEYFAAPGYDLCTGLGSPNGSNLISALITIPSTNVFTHLSAPLPPYGSTMAALNGGNPNGNWYLFVQDDQTFNSGIISNGWAIAVTTANPIGYVADDFLTINATATNLFTGNNSTISIGVTNYGPNVSSNVVVYDTLPLGFTLVSSNATTGSIVPSGQTITWNVGNLPVTAGAQENLTVLAGSQGMAIDSASVTALTPDQNPDDGSASLTFNVTVLTAPIMSGASVNGGKFNLTVSAGPATVIQASTNLINWVNIYTNTPPFTFTDTVTSLPYRFYRAQVP